MSVVTVILAPAALATSPFSASKANIKQIRTAVATGRVLFTGDAPRYVNGFFSRELVKQCLTLDFAFVAGGAV